MRSRINRRLESRVYNLQRGTIPRRQSRSRSTHDHVGEIVTTTVQVGECVQTMCTTTTGVDLLEESVIAIATQWETVVVVVTAVK